MWDLSRHDFTQAWCLSLTAPLFLSPRKGGKRESRQERTTFVEEGIQQAKMGETHVLAVRTFCLSEQSLCVSAAQRGDSPTVPICIVQEFQN